MIEIMKASAGSGKTFNLAKNYINILLTNKEHLDAFRHILAVTFTNKATDEMKTRILRELYILANNPDKSGFRRFFLSSAENPDAVCKNKAELKEAAGRILNNILHDYSSFSVSTIDKFFQRTLKSFAREIGHFASYQIELDEKSLVQESVDRVLDSINEDSHDLIKWLTDGAVNELSEGHRFNLENQLLKVALRLRHITHTEAVQEYSIDPKEDYSKDNIRLIENRCRQIQQGYISDFKAVIKNILDIFSDAGLGQKDFKPHLYNGFYKYADLQKGDIPEMSKTVQACLDPEADLKTAFFNKSDKLADDKLSRLLPQIELAFSRLRDLLGQPLEVYVTSLYMSNGVHNLGVASELYTEFENLMKEKNVMSLTDSDTILKDIINGSDAPFIYEKIGVRIENFLLDEFQDTSKVQWANLWPLLKESQTHSSYHFPSKGDTNEAPYSLIVGDVKQSIYRWRGSDWSLLDHRVNDTLEQAQVRIKNTVLEDNYRSLREVVEFNNKFFPFAADKLGGLMNDEGAKTIKGIYETTAQNCKSSNPQEGSVDITFTDEESLNERVLMPINEMRDRGISFGDIAILVRTNSHGSEIAEYLIGNNVPVVTNDSLMVRNSLVIRLLVAYLSLLDNPDDKVSAFMIPEKQAVPASGCHSLIDTCEFFLRKIEKSQPGILEEHTLYIQSFLDIVQEYSQRNGNNLRGFLEEWADNTSSISSPDGNYAVNVITVHKSKGLEYPYVIYYYKASPTELSIRADMKFWCAPKSDKSVLSAYSKKVFDVGLSSKSEKSMFRDYYYDELQKLYVDTINVLYVAFTRASKGLHIIVSPAKRTTMANFLKDFAEDERYSFNKIEDDNVTIRYRKGELYDFTMDESIGESDCGIESKFVSIPLNEELTDESVDVRERGRLKFRSDAVDFFSDEGFAGIEASNRIKGTILHKILSSVNVKGDIDKAVDMSFFSGEISDNQVDEVKSFLAKALDSVAGLGWFSGDSELARNEVSLIDTDGSVFRPDRVVIRDGKLIVIDYKFGEYEKKYERQIMKYVGLYRRIGYENVSGYLWFVGKDKDSVMQVC